MFRLASVNIHRVELFVKRVMSVIPILATARLVVVTSAAEFAWTTTSALSTLATEQWQEVACSRLLPIKQV